MKIRIATDETLGVLSGTIRRETFVDVLKIVHPAEKNPDAWTRVGSPFGPAYELTLTNGDARELGILYVSLDVKRTFYPDKSEIVI